MERKEWVETIRAVACVMVVIVHVTVLYKGMYGRDSALYGGADLYDWVVTISLDSASRMCVPLFFMVSGFIFLNGKKIKLKNIARVFTVLTFYSVISIVYYHFQNGIGFAESFMDIYKKPAMYHLWFLYYLIIMYFIFMFISAENVNIKSGLLAISFMFFVFNFRAYNLYHFIGLNLDNYFVINNEFIFLFFYCVAGALIGRASYNAKYVWLSVLGLASSIPLIILLTYFNSISLGRFFPAHQSYTSISVFISSISMFYLLKWYKPSGLAKIIVGVLSRNSLAIYGIHAIILEFIISNKMYYASNAVFNMAITFTIVIILSYLYAVSIKKIDKKGYVS
ncbi:acyltransferase [Lelliottia wanjuensis]|uniref:acyltransferase n=1 Tax=Lelliottia wanjuensis TaxID=3050585 RepID=UPI00254DE05F|nr:acyltransferase family protein [Lelliottia sp. V104_15]MDK9607659.1 acyltransferase family protein [Lelliottia sp. V104_15]